MTSFLEDVIIDLKNKPVSLDQFTFILPNKRASIFLKELLSKHIDKTIFSPEILSIESFVETLSDLKYSPNIELLFDFYDVYLKVTPKIQHESFDRFSKWAQILLQDFNEIDRYLIPTDTIFNYLSAIKEINHWSLDKEQTTYVKNYISFWNRLPILYSTFKQTLLEKKKGYQGLVYREAVNNLEQYISINQEKNYVFIGFNALNKAEEIIIQELVQQGSSMIYWDIDETFINDPIHDAGLFTRKYKTSWPYFIKHPFNRTTQNYTSKKNINVIGLSNTAIVLGDENLLVPLLNSIPKEVGPINITMGLPLKSIAITFLFETLFKLHKSSQKSFYYKDVIAIVSNPFIKPLFKENNLDYSDKIENYILENNVVYISPSILKTICENKKDLIGLLFDSWNDDPNTAIENSLSLIFKMKQSIDDYKSKNLLSLEYLYRIYIVFNELQELNKQHSHVDNINTLFNIYKEIIANETLDFKGEPLKGLQIMGVLESRVLDFETLIISSVNEGILPAGKTHNSFIPFDVKFENGLPTFKEKDAIYTYHFYRLLQRAKNVYIIYNTEPDALKGGEKSRFITQLEIENIHKINHYVVSPKVPSSTKTLMQVKKTDTITERLKTIAEDGFSPSSLSNYIRNPIDFYYEKVLGIKMFEEVEETVAANTLGSILHKTLEDLYTPVINRFLIEDDIKNAIALIEPTVKKHFEKLYKNGDFTTGKNLIVFEIAKRYVSNFLNKELELLKNGNTIKILALEENISTMLNFPELNYPVKLKGVVDRIDEYNGVLRIIDYKSGKVIQSQVEIGDWDDLLSDYNKYSKCFQVLCYAYMLNSKKQFSTPFEGGVISFKNLQGDYFLKFSKRESINSRTKDPLIAQKTLDNFYVQLKNLILEICNPNIPFTEKPIK